MLRTDDVNFDGYNDLILSNALCYESRFCSETDHFWLYDPKPGQFVYSAELSYLPGPTWDSASRTLKSSSIDFDSDGLERDMITLYQWRKGHVVLVEESTTQFDGTRGQRMRTIRRLIDGQWQTRNEPVKD